MSTFIEAATRIQSGLDSDLVVASTAYSTSASIDDEKWWFDVQANEHSSRLVWFRDHTAFRWANLRCASSRNVNRKLVMKQFSELCRELKELGTAFGTLSRELSCAPTFLDTGDPVTDWLIFLHREWSDRVELWRDAPITDMTPADFDGGQWAVDEKDDLNRYWPPQEIVELETTIGRSSIRDVVLASRMAAAFLAGRVTEWECRALEQDWSPQISIRESTAVATRQSSADNPSKHKRQKKLRMRRKPKRQSASYHMVTVMVKDTILSLYYEDRHAAPPSNREIARRSEVSAKTVDRRMDELFGINNSVSSRSLLELLWEQGKLKDFFKSPLSAITGSDMKKQFKKLAASE
jgi:hypothetical protein